MRLQEELVGRSRDLRFTCNETLVSGILATAESLPDKGGTLVLLGGAVLGLFVVANRLRR
jgi:hypothetical protein